jgi:hypothetical protein
MTMLKFNIISDALNTSNDDLNKYFVQCIEDPFIRDIRIEQPPFMLRTDLSATEIQEKINTIVQPICKDILNGLFKLDKSKRKVVSLEQNTLEQNTLEQNTLEQNTLVN